MTLLLPLILACAPTRTAGGDDTATDGGSVDGGSATDGGTATDGGAETDGGSGDGGSAGDGGGGDGGGGDGPGVSAISLEVHDSVRTIIEAHWAVDQPVDAAWIEYAWLTEENQTPVRTLDTGGASEVLLGIPAETEVTATLWLQVGEETWETPMGSITTGALPSDLDLPELVMYDALRASSHDYLLTSVDVGSYDFYGPCYSVILDRQGRVVWYFKTSGNRLNMFTRPSRLGGHVTIDATVYYAAGLPTITRTTLDRRQEEEIEVDGMGFTYDELDDGSFVYDYAQSGVEYHLQRQYPDGSSERIWSCYPWMSAYTTRYWGCAVNTVLWDPDRNAVLWSMFETSTVTEIDLETGEQLWWAGQTPDGYTISPASSMLELQHYPNWTEAGTLLTTTHVQSARNVQAIREFEVDHDAGTLTEVWSYLSPEGQYGSYEGDVTRLSNGNTLIGYGSGGFILEVQPDGDIVWELSWGGHLTGHMTLLDDLYALNEGW